MIADACPIDDLITAGLKNRPELAQAQALVDATLSRLKQARLRPFIPSLAFRYSGGGFGGGVNGFFGNFGGRSDVDVNLYWELQNLGMADRAIAKSRAAQQRTAVLQLMQLQDRVASEVVRADKQRIAAGRQLREAGRRPARGRQLPDTQPRQHPPRAPGCPTRPARSKSSSPSRRWPRRGPTTSTPSSPTTAPSSGSSARSVNRRCSLP